MHAGGMKCELEACYSLGLAFLPRLLERCLLAGDYI
jgi:hypothetical protein